MPIEPRSAANCTASSSESPNVNSAPSPVFTSVGTICPGALNVSSVVVVTFGTQAQRVRTSVRMCSTRSHVIHG